MIAAGLTGGIASGKSTVAGFLKQAGALIIDADRIARQVVTPGLPAWREIRDRFGDGILEQDGTINRAALGGLVFRDPALRRQLESIVHPRVGAAIDDQMKRIASMSPEAVVILDIPLLFESGMNSGLADTIVVYVPENIQLERLMARDGLSVQEAMDRISSQMPISEKIKKAGIIIDNSGTREHTRQQTLAAYRQLCTRAATG